MQWAGLGAGPWRGVVGSVAAEPERRTTSRATPKLRWALFLGGVVFWGLGGRVFDVVQPSLLYSTV